MSIVIDGKKKRIGLALSGGSFRAATYLLGVFRKLKELHLLEKIDLFSCVSRGSITGAFQYAILGNDEVLDHLNNYLRSKSIAVSFIISGLLSPFSSRLVKLAMTYDRDLFFDKNSPA